MRDIGWASEPGFDLTREDLREGMIYLCSLSKGGFTEINGCTFSIIDGSLFLSKKAHWEDHHSVGGILNKDNYKKGSIPCGTDIPCFKLIGKLENNGGFMSNSKTTKNLIITKTSGREFTVVHKKTREKWHVDKEGNGSTPEKYWETPIESELFTAIGV